MTEAARSRSDVVAQPTFLQPEPPRQDRADPDLTALHRPPSNVPPPHQKTADEAPYVSDSDAVKSDDRTADDGSSPESTGKPVRVRPLLTAQQIAAGRALAESILMGATALMNRRTRVHGDDDRWLMTRQEREAVAAPLGRIVARRSPFPGGVEGGDATDLADGMEAVVALIGYVIGQMTAERPEAPVYVPAAPEEPPAPAGPGAGLSPFDPAYKAG
ncbi:hypothetical protein [Streptomyces laurentii]|uniref:hypothetical protein n=1 Tax=Streptomyces laurentii TaxID=39478 RepID=UPI0036B613D5